MTITDREWPLMRVMHMPKTCCVFIIDRLCTVMHSSASERKDLIASQCRPDKETERLLLYHVLPLAQQARLKYGPVVGSLRVALLLKAGKR